jgi:hypothetical protein
MAMILNLKEKWEREGSVKRSLAGRSLKKLKRTLLSSGVKSKQRVKK